MNGFVQRTVTNGRANKTREFANRWKRARREAMDICLMTRTARGKTKNYKIYYIIFTSYRMETTGQVTDFISLIYLVSGSADGQGGRVFQLVPPVQLPQAHVRRHGGAGTRVRPIRQVSVNDNYYRNYYYH